MDKIPMLSYEPLIRQLKTSLDREVIEKITLSLMQPALAVARQILGNFLRRLALPKSIEDWSLRTMREIAEKPELMNARAVKVWTEAEIGRSSEFGKLFFRENYCKNVHRSDDTPCAYWNENCDLNYSGAIDTGDLKIFAEHWLDIGERPPIITDFVWVTIDDSGAGMKDSDGLPISHGGFTGQMSKYETTNAQYCEFLNAALESNELIVDANDVVIGANGSNGGVDYVGRPYFYLSSDIIYMYGGQITWTGTSFKVRSRDGYDMSNHPVVAVSWYGAMAFCNYYGYCLPTEWEWQAVADHNGEFTYGCGTTIDQTKANYYWGSVGSENYCNPLGLSSRPYTSPVNHYPPYGYGLHDMAGNVFEWTDSWYSDSQKFRVLRGGSWLCHDDYCAVSFRTSYGYPHSALSSIGFRVCR